MSESTIKINAVVIRSKKSGENDRLLTLLSPEFGKLSVIAKGACSLRHKDRSSTVVFTYSSFVLKKIREGFYSLVSAELLESFKVMTEDVLLLSYAAYLASLCEICVSEGMGADEEVRLLLNSFHMLCVRKEAAPLIKCVFELKLCECAGLMPEISETCPCGKPASFFSVENGEVRCTEHSSNYDIKIAPSVLELAMYITQSSLKDAMYSSFNQSDAYALWAINERFLEHHMGNLPKSLTYLHDMLKNL